MEPFVTHRGRVAVLSWSDVNTDLIIPARYLKRIERTGYGPLLFADKRYQAGAAPPPDDPDRHGLEDPGFPLNAPSARGATVLVVGKNFGCGSSREHAVWAVAQAGYPVSACRPRRPRLRRPRPPGPSPCR
jgi:3-isopropylmalate/(R)-2-methylmalate dehydratase small subunit